MYELPESLREELAKPFGLVFERPFAAKKVHLYLKENSTPFLISVGDVTTKSMIAWGRFPHLSILDGFTKRGVYHFACDWSGVKRLFTRNSPATISKDAWSAIEQLIKELHENREPYRMNRGLLFVVGEEDLLVLPSILLAPDDAVVLYGQPNVGVVLIRVNEESRNRAKEILEKMVVNEDV